MIAISVIPTPFFFFTNETIVKINRSSYVVTNNQVKLICSTSVNPDLCLSMTPPQLR